MRPDDRKIVEAPLYQGEDEDIPYTLTTTPWGSSPTGVSVVIKDNDGVDVSSTHLTGSPSVAGDVITLPNVHSLTVGEEYRLEIAFTAGGIGWEAWTDLYGEE